MGSVMGMALDVWDGRVCGEMEDRTLLIWTRFLVGSRVISRLFVGGSGDRIEMKYGRIGGCSGRLEVL
ncbi:hypothetical protein, partial [Candidatus Hodgkinia cicadicola]